MESGKDYSRIRRLTGWLSCLAFGTEARCLFGFQLEERVIKCLTSSFVAFTNESIHFFPSEYNKRRRADQSRNPEGSFEMPFSHGSAQVSTMLWKELLRLKSKIIA